DRAIRLSINLWARQHATVRPMPRLDQRGAGHFRAGYSADVAVSPDGRDLLAVDTGGNAQLWDLATGKPRVALPLEPGAPPVGGDDSQDNRAAFSPDGRFVAATRQDFRVRIWNAATGQPVGKPLVHDEPVRGINFDPTGKVLATVSGKAI